MSQRSIRFSALPSVEPSVPEPSQVLTPAANLDEPALDQFSALPPITDSEPQPSQVLTPASELPEPEAHRDAVPVSGRILAPAGSTPPATARLVPRQVLAVDQDPAEAPVSDRDAAATMIDRLTAGTAMLRPRKVMGVTEDE